MKKCIYTKDRALAELFSYILIVFDAYKLKALSKSDYEIIKRRYLYDKKLFEEMHYAIRFTPEKLYFFVARTKQLLTC